MWPQTLDAEFIPSPEGRGEWTHLQSSGGHCRDGSGPEDSDVCSTEKPRAGGPEHLDHILCRRRFAVPAGVEVISIPIWTSFAFQSVVQEIQCPALPGPLVARRCLQIRCLPLAETARRESGRITLSCIRCRPHRLCSGTSVIIPS